MPPLLTSSVGIAQRFAQTCPTMVGISRVSGLTIRLSVPPHELQYITGTRKGNREFTEQFGRNGNEKTRAEIKRKSHFSYPC